VTDKQTDRRTDGQTDGIAIAYTRYSIYAVARKNGFDFLVSVYPGCLGKEAVVVVLVSSTVSVGVTLFRLCIQNKAGSDGMGMCCKKKTMTG